MAKRHANLPIGHAYPLLGAALAAVCLLLATACGLSSRAAEGPPVVTATAAVGGLITPLLASATLPPNPSVGAISPTEVVTDPTVPPADTSLTTPCILPPTPTLAGSLPFVPPCLQRPAVVPTVLPVTPITDLPGLPAITPRYPSTDPLTPSFTADDAAQYVLAHPWFGKIDVEGPITIARVTFAPAAQSGQAFGLDPNRLVCTVVVSGTFHLSAPPTINTQGTATAYYSTFNNAYALFDAHTGNSLGIGGG